MFILVFGIILAPIGVEMKIEKAHFGPITYKYDPIFMNNLVQFFLEDYQF